MDVEFDRELHQAFSFLKDAGIDLRPADHGYDVWLSVCDDKGGEPRSRPVAKVVAVKEGWEISIVAVTVFWGRDWEAQPDLIVCDSLDGVMQFLYESLIPRINSQGVLTVRLPEPCSI